MKPFHIRIKAAPPGIPVRFLLDDRRLLRERCGPLQVIIAVRISRSRRAIRAGIERRVYINEAYLTCELGEERRQDVLFVSPYEAVAPFGFVAGGEEFKIAAAVGRAFVHRLDGLEGQRDPHRPLPLAVRPIFPFPNQFGHQLQVCGSNGRPRIADTRVGAIRPLAYEDQTR